MASDIDYMSKTFRENLIFFYQSIRQQSLFMDAFGMDIKVVITTKCPKLILIFGIQKFMQIS